MISPEIDNSLIYYQNVQRSFSDSFRSCFKFISNIFLVGWHSLKIIRYLSVTIVGLSNIESLRPLWQINIILSTLTSSTTATETTTLLNIYPMCACVLHHGFGERTIALLACALI